jgi:flagellar hook-associated protein FlgK
MTDAQRQTMERIAEIDAKITRVKQWGALLTALNEERQALLRSLEEEQR